MAETDGWGCDPEAVAVLLFTSGTTGEPKAAVLRHRNLAAYIVTSLEFGGAGEDEAAVVSVPPYHIAAVSSVLSSTYTGRRVVQLESFEPQRLGAGGAGRSPPPTPWSCPRCSAASSTWSTRTGRACPRCARSPTAVVRCRGPWSNGRWGCWATSTS